MDAIKRVAKAIVGFFAPGIALLPAFIADNNLSNQEVVQVLVACVVTAVGVYAVPNKSADYRPHESVTEPGH